LILNSAAWTQPTVGTYGSSKPRFSDYRNPRYPNEQMGIGKSVDIKEGLVFEVRADFFNVFNRANFMDDSVLGVNALPNFQKVSASSFGAIQQASDPRIGQLALKLYF